MNRVYTSISLFVFMLSVGWMSLPILAMQITSCSILGHMTTTKQKPKILCTQRNKYPSCYLEWNCFEQVEKKRKKEKALLQREHTVSRPNETRVKLASVIDRIMACLIQKKLYVESRNLLSGSKRSIAVISPFTPAWQRSWNLGPFAKSWKCFLITKSMSRRLCCSKFQYRK